MADAYTLRELYNHLKKDVWRSKRSNRFSNDVALVNRIMSHPYATNNERTEALSNWFQRQQPCLFGRIAAARGWLHYCVLTDEDFQQKSDGEIAASIQLELLAWRRRSVRPTPEFSVPAHGFVLVAASERLQLASPDEHLCAFAQRLLDLWGCAKTIEPAGTVHWETLYLQSPVDHSYVEFSFSVDFFAVQGDRRWWHDHRVPGGLAFTANSVGHMRRYREWYSSMQKQTEWTLQTAMLTINLAAPTQFGKATWLKDLAPDGRPVVSLSCPFANPERLRPDLQGKDWTRYGGFLHTDHSIRPEFFRVDARPGSDLTVAEYLEDFTYLYDPKVVDHTRFVTGVTIAEEDVVRRLGPTSSWGKIASPTGLKLRRARFRPGDRRRQQLNELLSKSRSWKLSAEEVSSLSEF
jgi:hypothetical protein